MSRSAQSTFCTHSQTFIFLVAKHAIIWRRINFHKLENQTPQQYFCNDIRRDADKLLGNHFLNTTRISSTPNQTHFYLTWRVIVSPLIEETTHVHISHTKILSLNQLSHKKTWLPDLVHSIETSTNKSLKAFLSLPILQILVISWLTCMKLSSSPWNLSIW